MKRVAVTVLAMITSCMVFVAIHIVGILPPILASESITVSILISSLISIPLCLIEYRLLRGCHRKNEAIEEGSQLRVWLENDDEGRRRTSYTIPE
jgi:hypothetical protein